MCSIEVLRLHIFAGSLARQGSNIIHGLSAHRGTRGCFGSCLGHAHVLPTLVSNLEKAKLNGAVRFTTARSGFFYQSELQGNLEAPATLLVEQKINPGRNVVTFRVSPGVLWSLFVGMSTYHTTNVQASEVWDRMYATTFRGYSAVYLFPLFPMVLTNDRR